MIEINLKNRKIVINTYILMQIDYELKKCFINCFTHSIDFTFSSLSESDGRYTFSVESELGLNVIQNVIPIVPVQIKQNIVGV